MTFQPGDIVRKKDNPARTAEVWAVHGDWFWRSSMDEHWAGGISAQRNWELVPQPTVEWCADDSRQRLIWEGNLQAAQLASSTVASPIIRRTTFPDGTVTYEREDGL